MSQFLKALGAAAVLGTVAIAAPAFAAPITVNGTCSTIGYTPGLAGSIACDKFDNTGLSPLTSMTLQITGQIDGTIRLFTGDAAASGVIGQSNNKFFLTSALTGFTFPVGTPPLGSSLFTVSGNTGPGVNLAPNTSTLPIPVNASGSTANLVNNSALAGYQTSGFGQFFIPIDTLASLELFGTGSTVGGEQNIQQRATALVTYTYDDGKVLTPEPATIAVLGMGMLALGAYRRRRQG